MVAAAGVLHATPPPLHTSASGFAANHRYVATSVFHWYSSNAGQLSGPWLPLEGRSNWTGEPDWWQGQIKQLMAANIDVLYVHLIHQMEAQRINLFIALDQLRAEGYDTPKVAPFLDPLVIWHDQPLVNLATEDGKEEFTRHYIRFFEQYFDASSGDHAADYLARQDDKLILNTWHVKLNVSNISSFTREDLTARLVDAFGSTQPYFTNGIVMVTTALNPPTLSFADEQVAQFEVNEYYRAVTFNGIRSVQLKGGYWDQNIRHPGDFLARLGGVPYRNAWGQVDRDVVHRVYIESWNEYDEGTGIYAVDASQSPHVAPANTSGNSDTWSVTGDPFEFIKTTAHGAAAFNDNPELGSEVLWHNLPATLTPGEMRTAAIIIRNTGDESWSAAKGFRLIQEDPGPAFVSGKQVPLDDGKDEIPLYGGIFRGRPKQFEFTLSAPATPGSYTTRWRMHHGDVGEFGQELTVAIEVREKSIGTLALGDLTQVADGTPRTVSVATVPPGLNVVLTYDGSPYPPIGPGTYVVTGTIDHPDFHGRAATLLNIIPDPDLLATTGGFENQRLGAAVSSPPDVVDAATMPGWRVFNVDSANASFNASIVDAAFTGTRAMRLHVDNSAGGAAFALDQWAPSMHTPVERGARYVVSFDAAWVAGQSSNNLLFQVQEFDDAGNYLGNGLSTMLSVADAEYKAHTFVYQPVHPETGGIGLFFGPLRGAVGTTTIHLDHIRLFVAPALIDGDFNYKPIGTRAGGTGVFVNTTTFPGWRLFSVGSPPISSWEGEVVDAGGFIGGLPGTRALLLEVANTGSPASHDYGLDNDNARTPVMTGKRYTLSYDIAVVEVVGGSLVLTASIAEFDAQGMFTGIQAAFTPTLVADQAFRRHSHAYSIASPNTTHVLIAFRPVTSGRAALVLDNVAISPVTADAPVSLSLVAQDNALLLDWPESHIGWRAQFNTSHVNSPNAWVTFPGSEATNRLRVPVSPALPEIYLQLMRD